MTDKGTSRRGKTMHEAISSRAYPIQRFSLISSLPAALAIFVLGVDTFLRPSSHWWMNAFSLLAVIGCFLVLIHQGLRCKAAYVIEGNAIVYRNVLGKTRISLEGMSLHPFSGLIWMTARKGDGWRMNLPAPDAREVSNLFLTELRSSGVILDLKGWGSEMDRATGSLRDQWLAKRRRQARAALLIGLAVAVSCVLLAWALGFIWIGVIPALVVIGCVVAVYFDIYSAERGELERRALSTAIHDLVISPDHVQVKALDGSVWSEDIASLALVLEADLNFGQRLVLLSSSGRRIPLTGHALADAEEVWARIRGPLLALGIPSRIEDLEE